MLSAGMYVRCPADHESPEDPRIFICAQVLKVSEYKNTATVRAHDPLRLSQFFEDIRIGVIEYPLDSVDRCTLFEGTTVFVDGEAKTVVARKDCDNGQFCYYLQDNENKTVDLFEERDIVASFTNGRIDPAQQLKNYEFQNPCWYFGHAVVSRSQNILENSIYGFKILAGSKIRLLPHQVNTIMRCLQEKSCRYILADEVGMGKTIEALSVLKVYNHDHAHSKAIIVTPSTLKQQWKNELLLKFGLDEGVNDNNNFIQIKAIEELLQEQRTPKKWDFVIVDEVHRYLTDSSCYRLIHDLSMDAKNVLLLSATPVQQREEEYLDLLRLLEPKKYDGYSLSQFAQLVELQGKIIQKTALVLDDLEDYIETVNDVSSEGNDPHEDDECEELFEDIHDSLESICSLLQDAKLTDMLEKARFGSKDCGVLQFKVLISYICTNYQIESNIIRNRRRILEANEEGQRILPTRQLIEATYELDNDKNTSEALCYQMLSDWLYENKTEEFVDKQVRPLLSAFFSSPWAFEAELARQNNAGAQINAELLKTAKQWSREEDYCVENVTTILEDPFAHEAEFCTRLITTVNLLSEELYDKKIVLFTNFEQTFDAYRKTLLNVFGKDAVCCFGANMEPEEVEVQAYAFQSNPNCRMMLCDKSGGEGRNFQCADYVLHIDLPWDASQIEQRIGRLDRLEREAERPVVTSVVIHTTETFEDALFDFWNEGLMIFTQSLSGMEIIMKDVNKEIESAVVQDYRHGLFDKIPVIVELADAMRAAVRKEQSYDAAGFVFRPMFIELKKLIDYYAANENELFASSMTRWASLSGFKGYQKQQGIITYDDSSFSQASAVKSQLIPPKWDEYLSARQNKFVNKVQESYNEKIGLKHHNRAIEGTFIREQALTNDYLHFFAPGDAVFDCIVDNAISTCKGKSSAFSVPSRINWRGLIFTWTIGSDTSFLMDKGISMYALGPYRHFLMSTQITVPVSLENPDGLDDSAIVNEYLRIINSGFNKRMTRHLGQRGKGDNVKPGMSNAAWFREAHPEERWKKVVDAAREAALKKATGFVFRKAKSSIISAKTEMDRVMSAQVAKCALYGTSVEEIEKLQQEQNVVLQTIAKPSIVLDSAAYVWLVN